ncbi:MAG TPA: alpha/beta hydrolase [Acidimicrobiia bacterium]|nr:alpha/beta hydrolase [Acidimicrobiia bacterium]
MLTGQASLYYRDIGQGSPIIVVHGGPDFDHSYLLPELDHLADSFRLIYYDQRGRGRSAVGVEAENVTIRSEMEDLERLRRQFQLEAFAVLGHSWGGVLAMEYAIRYPDRVSHLILMTTAPASHDDSVLLREHFRRIRPAADVERMQTLSSNDLFKQGDFDVEAGYYWIHFGLTLPQPELLERVVGRLRTHFTKESVLTARAIEHRLYEETWLSAEYDLLPKLRKLRIPTLVIHGDEDFIPIEVAAHIARAVPGARLSVLIGCGHFAYLQQPDQIKEQITATLARVN